MDCTKCDRDAVMHAAYSGAHLCEPHFLDSVETRVRRRIRTDNMLSPDTTPDDPETWVIGLSGGKDSAVLTDLIEETFRDDPRVELIALTIHEGIAGYRDESLDACTTLAADRDIRHELVTYREEFDVAMDDVADDDPLDMAPCAYCGVFRRDLLAKYADEYDADKLLTGHNLDDEAETALMNILEGNVTQIATHFDASLGSFDDRAELDAMIPRAKPLRDIPEKEVALYAQLRDLPVHMAECPHASESFRSDLQEVLLELEDRRPGTRHSIMAGYEELAGIAADEYNTDDADVGECSDCGAPTTRDRCRKCTLVDAVTSV
ncbi:TIGR00269 family protein [Halobacterium salinarum]|uniref:tRNA 2-thiolation protein NcsA n=1 Tax=Halobacterium salinarum TaxID=2242 RepID=UPI001F436B80|nr:TIGR00269 family protein [Halobacterium salinarum]MCF2206468.1 TIGR00269 family protein [Halobacterium salinarum]